MARLRTSSLAALAAVALIWSACDGEVGSGEDAGPSSGEGGVKLPDCATSQSSGLWLLAFGPVSHEINTTASAKLTVILNQSAQGSEGKPAAGKSIAFKIISAGGDAKLDKGAVATDTDGMSTVTFTAGSTVMLYQVEASFPGTCAVTFSVDVKKPLRQLRAVTPNPYDTFTNSRVPITVEARTDGFAKLPNEEITFKVDKGGTTENTMDPVGGKGGTSSLKVKTDGAGRATVMFNTGSTAINELWLVASMKETAPVNIKVRIATGSSVKNCKSDADCPLGYTCKNGKCEPPVTTPPSGCKSNADCSSPLICDTNSGKCLKGTGKSCDPIEGTGCAPGEICINRQCAILPKTCKDNSACPSGFKCVAGKCVPSGKPPTGGCVTNKDCPTGQVCVNGVCKSKSGCKITHKPDRLKGTWKFDSMLHLRDALNPVLKGILGTAGTLSTIINGSFKIKGVPSFINSIVSKYLKKLVGQYVPPWGQQLVTALGAINDICDDMRVMSTVMTTSAGTDSYVNSEQWDLIEFQYQGKKVSSPPSAIPQVGQVKVSNYTSYEVCGTYYISKHQIKNKVGGIIKWALETTLSLITCSSKSTPCFNSIGQALNQTINCQMLAMQLDQAVQSIWSGAPSVASIVAQACNSQKTALVNKLNKELNDLTVKLSLLELSGVVNIPNPGADHKLSGGKWNGVLGSGVAKGNFKGDFSATKGP